MSIFEIIPLLGELYEKHPYITIIVAAILARFIAGELYGRKSQSNEDPDKNPRIRELDCNLVGHIMKNFESKETIELCHILLDHDESQFSAEAFKAIQNILSTRGLDSKHKFESYCLEEEERRNHSDK